MKPKVEFFKEYQEINGFRIFIVVVDGLLPVYAIKPKGTARTFYFREFCRAQKFANSYQNSHSAPFWYRRWSALYSLRIIINISGLDVIPD